jgi:serine/threonine-protein kinase
LGLARVDEVDDTEELVDLYRDRTSSQNTSSNTGVFGGRVVGTPGYMAPEQAAGDYRSFDARKDVFGLGGSEPKKKGKLRQGILPRGQRVRKEAQDAIDALEAICLKALEPDKAKRYPDAEKMLVELNEWMSNTPGPPLGI